MIGAEPRIWPFPAPKIFLSSSENLSILSGISFLGSAVVTYGVCEYFVYGLEQRFIERVHFSLIVFRKCCDSYQGATAVY